MFIKSKPISEKQREQLKSLLDKQVYFEELIIKDLPKDGHLLFAHHLGKTCRFYIYDNSDENVLAELNESIWKIVK